MFRNLLLFLSVFFLRLSGAHLPYVQDEAGTVGEYIRIDQARYDADQHIWSR